MRMTWWSMHLNKPLRIQVCPKKGINPNQSYCGDGIGTINAIPREGSGFSAYNNCVEASTCFSSLHPPDLPRCRWKQSLSTFWRKKLPPTFFVGNRWICCSSSVKVDRGGEAKVPLAELFRLIMANYCGFLGPSKLSIEMLHTAKLLRKERVKKLQRLMPFGRLVPIWDKSYVVVFDRN